MFPIVAFVTYVFVSCITPGPNNMMCMANGAKHGVKKSMPFCVGVSVGFSGVLVLSILCNLFLYAYIPSIVQVVTYLGVAYIFYLAWVVFRDKPKAKKKHKITMDETSFFTAIVLQFVNPKAILFGMTLISSFVFPYDQSVGAFLMVLAFNFVVVILCCGCWVLFGSAFQGFFQKHRTVLNGVMALLLVYCGITLVL
ncbi:LysE family translocator [Chakrabartyella piscis]|uniref:LysE family translocator n=1 Tax=Chakrabartyella piscis TaxID=2918914 RepID=UPI0029587DDC|nr:LysE family transporter [Chakrabartyella piscis]